MLNRLAAGARSDTFEPTSLISCPGTTFMGCRSFLLATLIISAAGLVVALLVLAAVAFFLLFNHESKDAHSKTDEFTE